MNNPSFTISRQEAKTIHEIVLRAEKIAQSCDIAFNRLEMTMDLTACHANGTPLDLDRLLAAADTDFSHDVFGIASFINRKTGKLQNCFLPRIRKVKHAV